MTRAELDALCAGDSLIGVVADDEVPVVAVKRSAHAVVAHVRLGACVVPIRLSHDGPEIRCARASA